MATHNGKRWGISLGYLESAAKAAGFKLSGYRRKSEADEVAHELVRRFGPTGESRAGESGDGESSYMYATMRGWLDQDDSHVACVAPYYVDAPEECES